MSEHPNEPTGRYVTFMHANQFSGRRADVCMRAALRGARRGITPARCSPRWGERRSRPLVGPSFAVPGVPGITQTCSRSPPGTGFPFGDRHLRTHRPTVPGVPGDSGRIRRHMRNLRDLFTHDSARGARSTALHPLQWVLGLFLAALISAAAFGGRRSWF
jgi:hypothetical protein